MSLDNALIVGGIAVNLYALLGGSQSYEPLGGSTVHRMLSGAAKKQSHWRKLRTRISATGNIPPGLESLDWALPQTLACAAPLEKTGTGLVYTIPAGRRTDSGFTPLGYAYLGTDNAWARTALSLATNTATLTAVSGATAYRVRWWPLLTIYSDGPTQEQDPMTGEWRWELEAEES